MTHVAVFCFAHNMISEASLRLAKMSVKRGTNDGEDHSNPFNINVGQLAQTVAVPCCLAERTASKTAFRSVADSCQPTTSSSFRR